MPETCGVHQHNGQEHAYSLGCDEHCMRSKGHSGSHGEKQPGDDCNCLFKVGLDNRDRPEFEGWVPCPLHARAAEMRELIRRYKDSHELTTDAPYWKVCTCGWCEQARALLEETK